jgi:hypothetical protein
MVRIYADQKGRGVPSPINSKAKEITQLKPTEDETKQRRPNVVVATYKYLAQGVRILGEAYSTYDDRDTQ